MAASDGCKHIWKVFSAVFGHKWSSPTFQAKLLCVPAVRRKFSMLCQFCKRTRDWLLWICVAISVSAQSWLFSSIKSLKNDNRVEFLSHRHKTDSIIWLVIPKMTGRWVLHEIQFQSWFLSRRGNMNMCNLLIQDSLFPTACDVRLCIRRECKFHFYRTHRIGTFCNHNKQTQLGASILLNDP